MMRKILAFFLLTILFLSCTRQSTKEDSYLFAEIVQDMEEIPVTRKTSTSIEKFVEQDVIKKKIIKDGRLSLRVEELEKSKMLTDSLVKKHGGYYAKESFNNVEWESSFNLKIRIPYANFEKFISDIEKGNGEVQYKEIDARDVTDQFIDMETRLVNKRNYLKRYNELLKQAGNVKEILEIEEKIRGLEEEIESTTGKLKYLSDLVDYSTLELTIVKKKAFIYNAGDRDKFSERVKQSFARGWFGFISFFLFVINLWPFWIIAAVIIYFVKKIVMKRRKNRRDKV